MAAVHGAIVSEVHKTTLFVVWIEPAKAVTSFVVNIKPTQSCKTFKNIMIHLAA